MAKFNTYADISRMHKRLQQKYNGRMKSKVKAQVIDYEKQVQDKIRSLYID